MVNHNKCPLCGSDKTVLLYECADYLVSGEKFPVVKCLSCSFVFTNNYPEEEESGKYYKSDDYISHSDSDSGILNRIYKYVRRRMLASKLRMLEKESGLRSASVIDIGSGTGYFPAYLRLKGWECRGMEINAEAREYARKRNNIDLLSPGELVNFDPSCTDIVTFWHVLEHLYDPAKYLESVHSILKDNGLLVVAVPNHNSYDAGLYGEYWAAWDVPRHLWHFNPETIRVFCEKYNFRLTAIRRLPYDAFYVSVLSEKHSNSSFPLVRAFFTGFVSWLHSILQISRTSSLVYFFRKY